MMITKLPSIAIVDDDESVLKALRRLLQAGNMEPYPFHSGTEFLDSMDTSDFACVLLDIWMPELDGFAVARRLASKPERIPIVFMTAHDNESNRRRAADCGAADFLAKPVSEKQLFSAIHMAIDPERGNPDQEIIRP